MTGFVEELKSMVGFDGFVELLQSQKAEPNEDLLRLIGLMTTDAFVAMVDDVEALPAFVVSIHELFFDQ